MIDDVIGASKAAKIDRRTYNATHGKKVVQDMLKREGYAGGWSHRWTHDRLQEFDEFRRGLWTLRVFWSEGGRIHSASLLQDKIDPDTGKVALDRTGGNAYIFRLGMVARDRKKKERLVQILSTPDNERTMRAMINRINEDRRQ